MIYNTLSLIIFLIPGVSLHNSTYQFGKGITFVLGACFIWGLIFVVPQFLEGFTCLEIALGRYFFYGAVSSLIFLKLKSQGSCRYPWRIWNKALHLSLACSMIYYTSLVLALRYSTPAICALILGISPITIAFYGNWKEKEASFRSLIMPTVLISIGLIIINVPYLNKSESPSEFILGLFFGLLALISWTWYAVANAQFLKNNPQVSSSDWSTIIGVATFFWVGLCGLVFGSIFFDQVDWNKYFMLSPSLINFLVGCSILGLVCSWVGGFLWNRACVILPVSLAGQLTIFETIFGLTFVYALKLTIPPLFEFIGISFFLVAITYGIRSISKEAREYT